MEACLEALLEMDFCTKPPNFGVEAHMEAPAGDALRETFFWASGNQSIFGASYYPISMHHHQIQMCTRDRATLSA
jgi:hypothetical protein